PRLARRRLVVPDVTAGVGIERDDRAQEQVVAAARAVNLAIPRATIPRADVDTVELRVVGQRIPRLAAAADFPPLAGPRRGRHLHGVILETVGRVAGDDVEAPDLRTGLGIVGGHVAAIGTELAARVADQHLAIE